MRARPVDFQHPGLAVPRALLSDEERRLIEAAVAAGRVTVIARTPEEALREGLESLLHPAMAKRQRRGARKGADVQREAAAAARRAGR